VTTDRHPVREWPFWLAAVGLWIAGVIAVWRGQGLVGGALLLGAGGVLLLLRGWLRRRRGLDGRDDGVSPLDLLGP
jgi:O-antigen ligase